MPSLRSIVLLLGAALVAPAVSAASVRRSLERRWTPTGSSDNTNVCTPLELIWFRSGDQPQDALGFIGEPLFQQLQARVPEISAYNVVFNSYVYEELVSPLAAGQDATNWINKRAAQCPEQRYIAAGYSKGTLGVHQLYPHAEHRPRVVGSLVVGDYMYSRQYWLPLVFNSSWPSNEPQHTVKSLCNENDLVCWPGGNNQEIHFAPHYVGQIPAAVDWLVGLYNENLKKPFA